MWASNSLMKLYLCNKINLFEFDFLNMIWYEKYEKELE